MQLAERAPSTLPPTVLTRPARLAVDVFKLDIHFQINIPVPVLVTLLLQCGLVLRLCLCRVEQNGRMLPTILTAPVIATRVSHDFYQSNHALWLNYQSYGVPVQKFSKNRPTHSED